MLWTASLGAVLPLRTSLVPNVVQAEIMHNHCIPVAVQQFIRNMPCHIIVNLCEILHFQINILLFLYTAGRV